MLSEITKEKEEHYIIFFIYGILRIETKDKQFQQNLLLKLSRTVITRENVEKG